MTLPQNAVLGATLRAFFDDKTFWTSARWMDDESFTVFLDGDSRTTVIQDYQEIPLAKMVRINSGDVYDRNQGDRRESMTDAFAAWLKRQSTTVVVTVSNSEDKARLEALLSENGFDYQVQPGNT
jgi:hypothetical protein